LTAGSDSNDSARCEVVTVPKQEREGMRHRCSNAAPSPRRTRMQAARTGLPESSGGNLPTIHMLPRGLSPVDREACPGTFRAGIYEYRLRIAPSPDTE
jgi:hypothetical protein